MTRWVEAVEWSAGPSEIIHMSKQTTAQAPSFSLEALRAIVATPEARAMFTELMRETKSQDSTEAMDRLVVRNFAKAGFSGVTPRVDVMTYSKWIAAGFKVRPGEHAVKCKNLRLFCRGQVEPILKKEQSEYLAKRAPKTADRLPTPSPINPAPVAAKPAKGKAAPAQPAA